MGRFRTYIFRLHHCRMWLFDFVRISQNVTAPFKSPLVDVSLHRHRFLMMQGDSLFVFSFWFLFGFVFYICWMYMNATLYYVVYIYIDSIYCICMCFTCFSYSFWLHWYSYSISAIAVSFFVAFSVCITIGTYQVRQLCYFGLVPRNFTVFRISWNFTHFEWSFTEVSTEVSTEELVVGPSAPRSLFLSFCLC